VAVVAVIAKRQARRRVEKQGLKAFWRIQVF